MRASLAVGAGVFHEPHLGADLHANPRRVPSERRKLALPAPVPRSFPEAVFVGQVVLLMDGDIALVDRPQKALVEARALGVDWARADRGGRREGRQALHPGIVRRYGGEPDQRVEAARHREPWRECQFRQQHQIALLGRDMRNEPLPILGEVFWRIAQLADCCFDLHFRIPSNHQDAKSLQENDVDLSMNDLALDYSCFSDWPPVSAPAARSILERCGSKHPWKGYHSNTADSPSRKFATQRCFGDSPRCANFRESDVSPLGVLRGSNLET